MPNLTSQKFSIYSSKEMRAELNAEAERQGRSISWLLQQAWQVAQPTIKRFPGLEELLNVHR